MHEKLRRGRLRQHEPRLVKRLELIENAEGSLFGSQPGIMWRYGPADRPV